MAETDIFIDLLVDKQVREAFKNDPKGFLKKNNIPFPDSRQIIVLEDTTDKKYFSIRTPEEIERLLSEQPTIPEDQRNFLEQLAHSKEFRVMFKANPKPMLESLNMQFPNQNIEVVEDTDKVCYWILPEYLEITEEELMEQIADGKSFGDYFATEVKKMAGGTALGGFMVGATTPLSFPLMAGYALRDYIADRIAGR